MAANERTGLAYAVLGFATLSTGNAVVKSKVGAWPAFAVAALRFAIGATVLSLLLLRRWHQRFMWHCWWRSSSWVGGGLMTGPIFTLWQAQR